MSIIENINGVEAEPQTKTEQAVSQTPGFNYWTSTIRDLQRHVAMQKILIDSGFVQGASWDQVNRRKE